MVKNTPILLVVSPLGLVQAETADACIYMIIVILFQKCLLGGLKRDFGPGVQFFKHSFLVCFIMTS